MPARPSTGTSAGIVGYARVPAVIAALDMAAERRGATELDRCHDAPLPEAQILVDGTPSGAVAAEDICFATRISASVKFLGFPFFLFENCISLSSYLSISIYLICIFLYRETGK